MADALVELAGEARQRFDELKELLDSAPSEEVPVPGSEAESAPADEVPGTLRERVRLDALNMALTGSSRADTRQHLFESFPDAAVEDVDEILEATYADGDDEGRGPAAPAKRKRRFGRRRR